MNVDAPFCSGYCLYFHFFGLGPTKLGPPNLFSFFSPPNQAQISPKSIKPSFFLFYHASLLKLPNEGYLHALHGHPPTYVTVDTILL